MTGEGARLAGGRWNHKGTSVVYCSESLSLAALESFVHFASSSLPSDYVAIAIEIPDSVRFDALEAASLPADWTATPGSDSIKAIGTAWAKSRKTAVLFVPSAVIEQERNVLLNPDHPDFAKITARPPIPFVFDARLVKPSAPKRLSRPAKKKRRPRS